MAKRPSPSVAEKVGLFQRIALWFYSHTKSTLLIWFAIILFGTAVYGWLMKREGFPSVQVPVGIIQVGYPLKNATAVDAEVIKPIDEALRASPVVESISATSRENFGIISVRFSDETESSESGVDAVRAIVQKLPLPAGAKVEYQSINAAKFNNKYEALLSVTSPTTSDPKQLYDIAGRVAAAANQGSISLGEGYSAEVLDQYVEGTAADGTPIALQRTADRTATVTGGGADFKNSVTIGILAPKEFDIFDLQDRLEAFATRSETPDVSVQVSASFVPDINRQISGLQISLLEGLAIILIISLVLIHVRAGIVTGLSMVTVLLLTLIILYAFGFTLNTITLFALILCLGLIVDDTTIVVEAIDKESTRLRNKRIIISRAIRKVALASTAGTLTTMLGFAPLLFIGGVLGSFIRIMPITIITSLAMSLLVSITLVPFLSRWSIKENNSLSFISKVLQRYIAEPMARLLRFLRYGVLSKTAFSLLAISLSMLTLIAAGYYFQRLKFDIFPTTKDSNSLSIAMRFQAAATISDAVNKTIAVEKILNDTAGRYVESANYYNQITTSSATMIVRLVPYDKREITAPEIVSSLNNSLQSVQGVSVSVRQNDAGPPKEDLPFRVQIVTEDAAKAQAAVNTVVDMLNSAVLQRPNGTTARIINAQPADGLSILRDDGRRITEVRAGFDADDTSALVSLAESFVRTELTDQKLQELGLQKENIAFNFGSEAENQESFKSMLFAIPVLFLVMFVLLAVQFRSILQPFVIFLAVPFSLLGVAIGLYSTDNPLSFFVMIGLFALIGISVNNTILLTDYANQGLREGKTHTEAIADALEQRFRPLLITSTTAVVALIPLALSDPFWEPLCVTLIFGLIASTILVVTIFPYYYLMIEKVRLSIRRLFRRPRHV